MSCNISYLRCTYIMMIKFYNLGASQIYHIDKIAILDINITIFFNYAILILFTYHYNYNKVINKKNHVIKNISKQKKYYYFNCVS